MQYIIVDWGTSNFRAFLVDPDRHILDQVSSNDGLLNIGGQFQKVLMSNIGTWLKKGDDIAIFMSGMVGSRDGWAEVPYVTCPINVQDLLENLYQVKSINDGKCWIIPGVAGTSISGCFDVMRGEEVQFLGARLLIEDKQLSPPDYYCMPGTHNKWIEMGSDGMEGFSTTMTGELFNLLCRHSILSATTQIDSSWDDNVFELGLEKSRSMGGLQHLLFTVRSMNISGEIGLQQGSSYLSGLLLGNEIGSMVKSDNSVVAIIASEKIISRYLYAFRYFGIEAYGIDSAEATIAGSVQLAVSKEKL